MNIGSFLNRPPAPLIGIDISSSSIKLVELDKDSRGNWILLRCASEALGAGWVTGGNIEKFEEVVEALKRLIKKSGSRTKNLALAIPHSSVITKKIVLPGNLSEQELEIQVESEASQYIPSSLDEVNLDFCIIGPNEKYSGDIDIVLAATRKEKVEDLNNLGVLVGLKPLVIDIDSYASRKAVERCVEKKPKFYQDKIIALIKIGSQNFNIQILKNNEVLHDSEQGIGGNQLTQMISKQYGISLNEAELKKKTKDLPPDFPEVILKPFIQELSQDVVRILQFFYTSTSFHRVDHIFIFGGAATANGLTDTLESLTGVPTQVINPFENMKISPNINKNKIINEAGMYLTACGLAMRRFSL